MQTFTVASTQIDNIHAIEAQPLAKQGIRRVHGNFEYPHAYVLEIDFDPGVNVAPLLTFAAGLPDLFFGNVVASWRTKP